MFNIIISQLLKKKIIIKIVFSFFYMFGNIVETLSLFCKSQRGKNLLTVVRKTIEFFVLQPPSGNVTVASDIMVSVTADI